MKLTKQLAEPLAALQETARTIAEVQRECKLEVDPQEYVESFKPYLMDVIYAWSKVECLDALKQTSLSSNFCQPAAFGKRILAGATLMPACGEGPVKELCTEESCLSTLQRGSFPLEDE